jgi:hypothetical protein
MRVPICTHMGLTVREYRAACERCGATRVRPVRAATVSGMADGAIA